jgi:putative thioredoxin
MADSPYVFDATRDNFQRLVLENSARGPVLVNYWSPRAGPSLMLMPRLVRLATEFGGCFLLVMVNTDEERELVRAQGIVSLPTVQVFRGGRVVDTLRAAETEDAVRGFIERQLTDSPDDPLRAALAAQARGDTVQAVRLAAEAALADPNDPRIPLELAKLLVLQQRYAQADDLLQALPQEVGAAPELRRLAAHVGLLRAASEAPPPAKLDRVIFENPDDLEARYQLAGQRVVADDYAAAMDQLLEIARRDPAYRRGAAREGLNALFEMLGESDERVARCRALLQEGLH